jgi:RNA polymerase sigma-B factor
VPTITGELKRYIRDTGWAAHVTRDLQEATLLVARAADELAGTLGRSPSAGEVSAATGLSTERVIEAMTAATALNAESLDAPTGDDETTDGYGRLGYRDDEFERAEARSTVASVLSRLSRRERDLLEMRFGQDLTQSQIGARLGISQMHVSRLLRRAVNRASILVEA